MARTTTTTGKLLTSTPRSRGARATKVTAAPAVDTTFAAEWNALDKAERRQIRRLVRIGRPQDTVAEARMAVRFAAYQRTRQWYRLFWLWMAPLAVAGLIAGLNTHPMVLGMVFGALVVAYMTRRNYRRAETVNASVLDGSAPAGATPAAA